MTLEGDDKNTAYLKTYKEPEDRTLEALKLLANARRRFFLIAEDGISVPAHLLDNQSGQLISDRHQIAENVIASREALCAAHPEDRMARAKLAGAYVNMMGVLAEEAVILTNEKNDEKGFEAKCAEIGTLHSKITPLLSNVHLKGRKHDADQVLETLLGEVFKASIFPNEMVHQNDATKGLDAMREVDTLTTWMKKLMAANPRFSDKHGSGQSCAELVDDLSHQMKTMLGLRVEDIAARDEAELAVRRSFRALKARTEHIVSGDPASRPLAFHIARACDVMDEMLLQDDKKISAGLVIAIGESDALAATMHRHLSLLPPAANHEARDALRRLHRVTDEYLKNALRHGRSHALHDRDFKEALTHAEQAQIYTPSHMPPAKAAVFSEVGDNFREGVALMKRLPPDLSAQDPVAIRETMDTVRAEIDAFVERAAKSLPGKVKVR